MLRLRGTSWKWQHAAKVQAGAAHHADERLFDDRWYGDPAAHPFWMTATAWAIPLAVRAFTPREATAAHHRVLARAACCAAVGYLALINVPFLCFYYPLYFNGVSGYHALHLFRGACVLCVWRGCRERRPSGPCRSLVASGAASGGGEVALAGFAADRHRNALLAIAWLAVVLALSALCDPERIRRTGFGQVLSCEKRAELSFWGLFVRDAGLCPQEVAPEAHNFKICDDAAAPEADGRGWYTVCGAAMDPEAHSWLALHAFLAAATILFAVSRAKAATAPPPPRKKKAD